MSVNVRHGCTSCFTLPISNNTENAITYTIRIDDPALESEGIVDDANIMYNRVTYVSSMNEYRTIKDTYNMKHVDPNKINIDKYGKVSVEDNSTGFLVLK